MRGSGLRNLIADNVSAVNSHLNTVQMMNTRPKMCWRCQKDKQTKGGKITMFAGGPMKFICKECVEAKAKQKVGG